MSVISYVDIGGYWTIDLTAKLITVTLTSGRRFKNLRSCLALFFVGVFFPLISLLVCSFYTGWLGWIKVRKLVNIYESLYHCMMPAGVQITTDGRHVYLFKAGWPVGTAWVWLGSAQHCFPITLVTPVDWKNSKESPIIGFSLIKSMRTNNRSSLQCCDSCQRGR